jgi:hypothetical protein
MTDSIEPSQFFTKEEVDVYKQQIDSLKDLKQEDLSEYNYIFDDPNNISKQTDAQYEIYINLTANILKKIDDNKYPEINTVCTNSYHIPVPSGENHNTYIKNFFEYVEKCMISSAEEANLPEKVTNE